MPKCLIVSIPRAKGKGPQSRRTTQKQRNRQLFHTRQKYEQKTSKQAGHHIRYKDALKPRQWVSIQDLSRVRQTWIELHHRRRHGTKCFRQKPHRIAQKQEGSRPQHQRISTGVLGDEQTSHHQTKGQKNPRKRTAQIDRVFIHRRTLHRKPSWRQYHSKRQQRTHQR